MLTGYKMIKLSSVVPTPEWPRANCTNKPIERVVPDWLCVPYHKHPIMNEMPAGQLFQASI
jgi:hypothetical protein